MGCLGTLLRRLSATGPKESMPLLRISLSPFCDPKEKGATGVEPDSAFDLKPFRRIAYYKLEKHSCGEFVKCEVRKEEGRRPETSGQVSFSDDFHPQK